MTGRVYRRCCCRDAAGKELGPRCPLLADDRKHGKWGYAVDVPGVDGKRHTKRRHEWLKEPDAHRALADVRARFGDGIAVNDREIVAAWITGWLAEKRRTLKPKTLHQYGEYVRKDLVPALGAIRLEQLRHNHVAALVTELEAAGRGATTIRRIVGVLSSALSDAVKQRRLTHNAARFVALPAEDRAERTPWTAAQAVAFLDHVHRAGDPLADLFEVIIGTGLRRGEVLALCWSDVDTDSRALTVHPKRGTLSDVAGSLVFTAPKTKGSSAGVGLSARVVAAFERQRRRQDAGRAEWGEAYQDIGLVFARENGQPLRPEHVLARFLVLTEAAGLPRVRLHDLRHLAATLMIAAGVPLALVSKTLRHSKTAITADLYAHLTREAALAATDSLGDVLDAAAAKLVSERTATAVRPQSDDRDLLNRPASVVIAGERP